MQVFIIDNHTTTLRKLKKLLAVFNPKVIKVEDIYKTEIDSGALLVLSGSSTTPVLHHHVYDAELKLIRDHEGPIVGVCLGFELIAHAFGAHLHQRQKRQHGLVHLHRTNSAAAGFLPIAQQLVYVNHHYDVRRVASPLISLAESASGVQILRHESKPVFGFQFHPEVRRHRNNGKQIFNLVIGQVVSSAKS
ncbi:MAG: gamma-glutamyl-gamma-aminobutyrate hydrolase family protein [Candidatus Nomurabacteria bacterium]|jgi:GMP synthase (glutamine-hydrolysing)|nr:gamma-glutamyl-gamma-aminobutyrate hydrolase family protein [Candidatus Nomurabacteria bacterium]